MGKNTWSRPDREALNRVLANNKSNLEGIVLRLAWKQGLSREEIRQLTWNDVSFSSGQLILPDRLIPMEAETQACLQERYDLRGGVSPFVVLSERCRRQILPESVSRLARGATDQHGLQDVSLSDRRRENALRTAQAVTDTRLEELTREVREHNNFARRVPVLEEQIKVVNHRIADLEHNTNN